MEVMAAVALLGALAMTAAAQEPSVKSHEPLDDRELGQWAAANLERVLPIVHEPTLDTYIAQLGAVLAKYANSPFTYTFTVYIDRGSREELKAGLTSPAAAGASMPMDAFQGQAEEPVSVAGGPVFIPLSLLAAAPNEAVFAFQMAHAMAHIALRHRAKLAARKDDRRPGAMPMRTLTFAFAYEREADYAAMRMVSQAGYSPEAMAAYLSGQTAAESAVFWARPTPIQRSRAIRAKSESLPAATYTAATGGFAAARSLARAVVAPHWRVR
jgi:predicted Zn-dependent protease